MGRTGTAATLLVAAALAVYGALVLLSLMSQDAVSASRPLTLAADGRLQLLIDSGDVRIAATRGEPRISLESDRDLFGGTDLRIDRTANGRLEVEADCPGFGLFACGGSVLVLVPAGTAVDVDTGSGAVAVDGIRGGLRAGTGSGSVRLTDVGGPSVSVDTGSGEISGDGVDARQLVLETGSGSVRMVAGGDPQDVRVQTGSGEVLLTVPDLVYDVGTETGSGESQVGVRSDSGSPRQLRVQTGSGDVVVRPGR